MNTSTYQPSPARLAALQSGDIAALLAANAAEFGGATMELTDSGDVFVPEVYADLAQAKFKGAVKVAGSSAVIEDNTLEGQPGDSVTFPKWGKLGELDDLTEGVPMVPEKLGSASDKATIQEAGKAVEITSRAKLVSLGDPDSEATRQFGILAARKVDAKLIEAAQADETAQGGGNPFRITAPAGRTTFGYAAFLDAIEPFGDEWAPEDFAGIYLNSAHRRELLEDEQFIGVQDLARLGATVARGVVGELGGVAVQFTDRIAAGKFMVLRRASLGLLYKQRPVVERDRDILSRTDIVTTNLHYAVKRLSDEGVSVVTLASA